MATDAAGSSQGLAQRVAEPDAESGQGDSDQGGGVLDEHGVHEDIHAALGRAPQALARSTMAVDFLLGHAPAPPLEDGGNGQHDVVPGRIGQRRRVHQAEDAFIDGDSAADGEDRQRHDQRPDIGGLAVAEGMPFVHGALAAPHADEQQEIVAGVDERMDALGQHRGTAGHRRDQELGHCNGDVSRDGDVDHASGAVAGLHGGRVRLLSRRAGTMFLGGVGPGR
jgi:hypothetical protein